MSRNRLHKSKLEDFKRWLISECIEHRAGRGDFQVLQVRVKRNLWLCIYDKNTLAHYTVDKRMDHLLQKFFARDNNASDT